jgi:S-DNA-T family DNA segregation ATPase FtsK/SpoIIIE
MGLPLQQKPLWEEVEEAEAESGRDELFDQAVEALREAKRASISLLQRRLRIGYTRAARLIDQLEEAGIVGPAQHGSAAREVLDYGELAAAEGD